MIRAEGIYSVFCFGAEGVLLKIVEIEVTDFDDLNCQLSAFVSDKIIYVGYMNMPLSEAAQQPDLFPFYRVFTSHNSFNISVRF